MVKTVSFWSLLQTLSHRFWCSIKGEKGPLLCSPLYVCWQHHNKIFCTLVILAGILSANSLVNLGQLPVLQAKACLYKIMANYMHVNSMNHRVFFPWFIQWLFKKQPKNPPKQTKPKLFLRVIHHGYREWEHICRLVPSSFRPAFP